MRRVFAIVLIIIIIVSAVSLSGAAASPNVCFIAINETLLDLSVTPYFYGSAYVPYTVFTGLGIYYSYFHDSNTISLYRGDQQLYFDLNTGQAYDADDNYYTTSTLSQNGQTFVSVQFVCSFFGLNWSYINGIGYGDILRITDGGGYLSDNDFLYAAAPLMRTRYEAYMDALDQAVPPSTEPDVSSTPEPTPPPDPGIDDTGDETENHSGVSVYLSFEGLPSEAILDTLERYGAAASFYLSPDDIAASPDTVRRIAGSGHTIGIYCSASCDYDYLMGSELLFDAAQIQTVMVTSSGSSFSACESFASNSGLYFSAYDADATARGGAVSSSRVINAAASASQSVHIRLDCSEGTENILSSVLNYLTLNSYTLSPERES